MPGLTRRTTRLLRMVGNKQHATDEDHETASGLPSPPATSSAGTSLLDSKLTDRASYDVEDYTRSPISSDEETEAIRQLKEGSELQLLSIENSVEASNTKVGSSGRTKRKAEDSDSDEQLFSGLSRGSETKHSGSSQNVTGPRLKRLTYGSSQGRASQTRAPAKPAFKKSKAMVEVKTPARKQAAFRIANNADVFQFAAENDESHRFDFSRSSSILSSSPPSPPDVLDMTDLSQAPKAITNPKERCPVCGADVDILLRQEYEDQFQTRSELNVRRQQAFCRFHMRHDAREQWRVRRYPEIDWARLDLRMHKRHARLRRIISGGIRSTYRQELAQQIADRATKSAAQRAEDRTSDTSAGYYGPRGQRMMMKDIVSHLAESLREASKSDDLMMAAGTNAGLAGFVQRVLVPEMATDLIMEDMKVGRGKAGVVLAESKELGEILNDEERDVVVDEGVIA